MFSAYVPTVKLEVVKYLHKNGADITTVTESFGFIVIFFNGFACNLHEYTKLNP